MPRSLSSRDREPVMPLFEICGLSLGLLPRPHSPSLQVCPGCVPLRILPAFPRAGSLMSAAEAPQPLATAPSPS